MWERGRRSDSADWGRASPLPNPATASLTHLFGLSPSRRCYLSGCLPFSQTLAEGNCVLPLHCLEDPKLLALLAGAGAGRGHDMGVVWQRAGAGW